MSASKTKAMIIKLQLSPKSLAKFPNERASKSSDASKLSSSPDTPAQVVEPTPVDTPIDAATPMNGIDNNLLAPPSADAKGKKARPGPKAAGAGAKRGAAAVEGTPKPRGKPGPKKKQRMGDMINDPNNKTPFAAPAPVPKLGPKANMGTINANLRALDRTGKPCRKWGKKTFQIRSFTGVVWDAPTWRAPPKTSVFTEDVKSDTTSSTDSKIKDESSAISERSGLNGDASTPMPPILNGIASSPTPVPTAS